MAGLDALAIFGLACNVVTVISFSHETFSACKQFYENGTADPNLEESATRLISAIGPLEKLIEGKSRPLTKQQTDLIALAKSCAKVSKRLVDEVNKITDSAAGKGKLVKAGLLGVRRAWKKRKLEDLEKDLKRFQDAVESHVLVDLW